MEPCAAGDACLPVWGLACYLLNRSGALAALPEQIAGPAVGITLIGGFVVAIVVGGIIGGALRRAVWRPLFRRGQSCLAGVAH